MYPWRRKSSLNSKCNPCLDFESRPDSPWYVLSACSCVNCFFVRKYFKSVIFYFYRKTECFKCLEWCINCHCCTEWLFCSSVKSSHILTKCLELSVSAAAVLRMRCRCQHVSVHACLCRVLNYFMILMQSMCVYKLRRIIQYYQHQVCKILLP